MRAAIFAMAVSDGFTILMEGIMRTIAKSSSGICVYPHSAEHVPVLSAATVTGILRSPKKLRSWSYARVTGNGFRPKAMTCFPLSARPVATERRFCSAMPTLTKRCGNLRRNSSKLGAPKSADTITMSSPCSVIR